MINLFSLCPVCNTKVSLQPDIEETEIINCLECQSRLVVEKNDQQQIVLNQAPEIEEDWGE